MMKLIFIEPESLLSGSTCWAKHVAEGAAVTRPRPLPQPVPRHHGLQSEPQKNWSPGMLQPGS
jgi:hypothetical protein